MTPFHPPHRRPAAAALVALLLFAVAAPAGEPGAAVTVERPLPGGAAERAGLRAGDRLERWVRTSAEGPLPAAGELRSLADWHFVESGVAPASGVTLAGRRDGTSAAWVLPPGPWGLEVMPAFSRREAARYAEGREAAQSGDLERARALWEELAEGLQRRGKAEAAWWVLVREGRAWSQAQRWAEAREVQGRAADWARARRLDLLEALALEAQASAAGRAGDAEAALERTLSARAAWERAAPGGLGLARCIGKLAFLAVDRQDFAGAERLFRERLALEQALAPGSELEAVGCERVWFTLTQQGRFEDAEASIRRALEVRRALGPGGLDLAATLNKLGITFYFRGDLARAEGLFQESWSIQERLAPEGRDAADTLNNLGMIATERGDLREGERRFGQALALRQAQDPEGVDVAMSLANLGALSWRTGDFAGASDRFKRALSILSVKEPGAFNHAATLVLFGGVLFDAGDLDGAASQFGRAAEVWQAVAPGSLYEGVVLTDLACVSLERGDLAGAEAAFRRALTLLEKAAPAGLELGGALNDLGRLRAAQGDWAAALECHRRAGAIAQALAPGTVQEAEAHYRTGLVLVATGRKEEAAAAYGRAVKALEAQMGKLGGSGERRTGFAARYMDLYREYIRLLVDLGRSREAYDLLERSRARRLLEILAERDLVFSKELPPELDLERRALTSRLGKAYAALSQVSPELDPQGAEAARASLRALDAQRGDLEAKIREASPRLAELQYPKPLTLGEAQGALEPGTLLLAYSVGREGTELFALGPGPGEFRAVHLPVGEPALAREVRRFRALLGDLAPVERESAKLSRSLLGPAAGQVLRAKRLLISPDGPLHALPFAALAEPEAAGGAFRYLVERIPLRLTPSMTVYAELARPGAPGRDLSVVAFGDPRYAPGAAVDLSPLLRGVALAPLPATREEAESIAGLFGGRGAAFLGERATAENAAAVGPGTAFVHFACHGFADGEVPLNSGLVFAAPGDGSSDGVLRAWNVFESVRLDADLVALSACETGLGKVLGGEGMIGLTRAFQYAGARSVLSSLWSVSDESTALLMARFYGHLKAGQPKAEALRLAQLSLVHPPGGRADAHSRHPFFWAPFVLNGG